MENVIQQVKSISLAGMTQPELVDHLLTKGCEYLGIKLPTAKGLNSNDPNWKRKRYLITLLSDYTVLSQREIYKLLGYKRNGTASYHYKNIKDELSNETYGNDKTKLIYKGLLNYLKLQEK